MCLFIVYLEAIRYSPISWKMQFYIHTTISRKYRGEIVGGRDKIIAYMELVPKRFLNLP